MSSQSRWPVVLVVLAVTTPALADTKPCTSEDAAVAEEATDHAHESWTILNSQYLDYARAIDCDDGAIGEGWDDAVAQLLADSWGDLPALAGLVNADPDFLAFVVRHISASAATDDLQRAQANARGGCPSSAHQDICRLIADAAAAALADAGCSYPDAPKDVADARRRVAVLAPHVRWSTTLRVDLVGKGIPDYVMLGTGRSEAVVGVVLGSACDRGFVFRFKNGVGTRGALCGDPASVRVSASALARLDDPDAPLAGRGAPATRRRGFRLQAGDCDSIHFYFDGLAVRWWRR